MNDLISILLVIVSIMLVVMSYKYKKADKLLSYVVEQNKELKNKKKFTEYRVVTKDEFLVSSMQYIINKEKALEYWVDLSKGHSFVLSKGENNYYSIEYVDNYLS